jgi:hypothetical protein
MTAQIHDTILIDDKGFSIVGVNGSELFTPQSIGITPVAVMSACWRGYVCQYKINDGQLILDELQLSFGTHEGIGKERKFIRQTSPAINSVSPNPPTGKFPAFSNVYEKLNLEVRFTGGILAGDGFIQKLYVHMGFHPAWKYQNVLEIIFENGKAQEIRDVSKDIEQIRNKMSEQPLEPDFLKSSKQEREAWIEKTFRLNYDL